MLFDPSLLLVPDVKVSHGSFAVIREASRELNKVAIGRVVLTKSGAHRRARSVGQGLRGRCCAILPLSASKGSISTRSRTST